MDELFFEMFCFLIVFGVLGGADLPGVLGLAKLKKVRQDNWYWTSKTGKTSDTSKIRKTRKTRKTCKTI